MICSTCFGHLYAHHQELTIIYHFSPHRTSASWVLMVVMCGLAGYVAGLAATAVATLCPSSGAHDYIPLFTTKTSASWVLMVVRCGLAGYVAGLAATAVATLCPSSGAHDYIPMFTTWNVCFLGLDGGKVRVGWLCGWWLL
jgi:hypothetical protein